MLKTYVSLLGAWLLLAAVTTAAENPAVRIALVLDGHGVDSQLLGPLFGQELVQVLQTEFAVEIVADERFRGDDTPAGVRAALERALVDPRFDLVVCAGVLGSALATGHSTPLPRPVIVASLLSAEAQGLLVTAAGTSGVPGLSAVMDLDPFARDLQALEAVAGPVANLALLVSTPVLEVVPDLRAGMVFNLEGGRRLVIVDAALDAAVALARLPGDLDAVMLGPLPGYPREAFGDLIDGINARGLPSVAMAGEPAVRRGALVGTLGDAWLQRLARRVALNARRILTGQAAETLPVWLPGDRQLYVNLQTARTIGVYPPFAVTVDAVLIDSTAGTGRSLDLWQAMDEAMAANRDLTAMAARLAADREELGVVRSQLLPQIGLEATGTILDSDRAAPPGRPAERTLTAGATVSQILYSEEAWTNYSVQKRAFEASQAEYESERLDVALQSAQAYFEVLRAQTREQLQKANLELSRENLERARIRVQLGDASRAEEFRWQAKIAEEKATLMRTRATVEVARIELNRVLNRPLEEDCVLAEPDLDSQLSVILDPRLARYLGDDWHLARLREFGAEYARRESPELQQLRAAIAAQERVLGGAKRSFYVPDVVLAGSWLGYLGEGGAGRDPVAGSGIDDSDWNVSLAVSLPLFQGGRRFAEVRQAGSDLLGLRVRHEAAGERIEQDLRSSVHRTSASRAGIDLSRAAAAASRRNLDLVSDAYNRGAVDLITLLDAQNALLSAEIAVSEAVHGFLLDLMDLERSLGRFTNFATPEERSAWIAELEAWFAARPQ